MQKELLKALKIFGGFINLYFFRGSIYGNNPLLLTQNLAYIMGSAVAGYFPSTSTTTKIKQAENIDLFGFNTYFSANLW